MSLRPDQSTWLIATAGLSLLPHMEHFRALFSLFCVALLGWRGWLVYRGAALPPKALLTALTLALVVWVGFEFQQVFGKEPGVALLAGLLSLKLLETRSQRDGRAAVMLCFFLQIAQFFYRQDVAVALLALLGTFSALACLLALEGRPVGAKQRAGEALRLLVQGLPLMAVLFVLFPRVQGPLWGLPADAFALPGLSDHMRPGDLARLGESSEVAFRVDFPATLPPAIERYWRGPVLSHFDGQEWRAGPLRVMEQPAYTPSGVAYNYTLTLSAHNQLWLLALDYPAAAPGLRYSNDYQLLAREPVTSLRRLELVSYPHTTVGQHESPTVLQEALVLPEGVAPRTVTLGRQLREQAADAEAIPQLAIDYFRRSQLAYTLDPPPLGRDDVDSFLFDVKQGFCEHFAAAYVVTLRAAGVPARVVTGYQGGEINPVDGSLVVRQSDAHAWAEVWLDGRGWLRVNPTAASAPRRIERGLAAAMPNNARLPLLVRTNLSWLRGLRDHIDAFNNRWNKWVLGYNPARQRDLLSELGFGNPDWQTIAALMAGGSALVMLALTAWALRRRVPQDKLDRDWRRACERLTKLGLPRQTWEAPLDYARRIAAERPALSADFTSLATEYSRLRYSAAGAEPGARQRFHLTVKHFRPR